MNHEQRMYEEEVTKKYKKRQVQQQRDYVMPEDSD